VLSTVVSSSTKQVKEEKRISLENHNLVTVKVHVKMPNFKVLDEKDSHVITLIKEAQIPKQYEGSLIRLESESGDLSQIEKVFINLQIDKIIIYQKDKEIAQRLIQRGFNVILMSS
jgi:hypothetical protein